MKTKYHGTLLPGKFYHLFNHAVGDENIFRTRENYFYFMRKYAAYIHPVASTFCYSLLPNHFHFFIRINSEAELTDYFASAGKPETAASPPDFSALVMQQFSNFLNGYAKAFNKMFGRKGALFLDYVKRREIKSKSEFIRLVHYIHWNAVHHGFCNQPDEWEFSSFHAYEKGGKTKLALEEAQQWFDSKQQFKINHVQDHGEISSELEFEV